MHESDSVIEMAAKAEIQSRCEKYLEFRDADVHFIFPNNGPIFVPAHRDILASVSPAFKKMFSEPREDIEFVNIYGTTASAFKEFLQLVYLPEISFTMGNLEEIVYLVIKYGMQEHFKKSSEYLQRHLTTDNVLMIYQLAIRFNNLPLKTFCEQSLCVLTRLVLRSKDFLQCERKTIEQILQQNALECNEADLFEACIAWAKVWCMDNGLDEYNAEVLRNALGNCFYFIRFGAMEAKDLNSILSHPVYINLFTQEELTDIMQRRINSDFQYDIFESTPRSKALIQSNKLVCRRSAHTTRMYYVRGVESTWFSTNKPILMTSINLCELLSVDDSIQMFNATVEIVEHNTSVMAADAPFKVFTKLQFTSVTACEFHLNTGAIIIHPQKIYEIRVNFKDDDYNRYAHDNEWEAQELRWGGFEIRFHQNSSDCNSSRRGLVSQLNFHRMQ